MQWTDHTFWWTSAWSVSLAQSRSCDFSKWWICDDPGCEYVCGILLSQTFHVRVIYHCILLYVTAQYECTQYIEGKAEQCPTGHQHQVNIKSFFIDLRSRLHCSLCDSVLIIATPLSQHVTCQWYNDTDLVRNSVSQEFHGVHISLKQKPHF